MKGNVLIVLHFLGIQRAWGHGILWDPPNRASLWRFGYDTPINYNDGQYYCGGIGAQISEKFSCGICGDPYDDSPPRSNENGGTYGRGIITRKYEKGSLVPVTVNLKVEHKGYFEFHLCNLDENEETEKCFRTVLFENGSKKFYVNGSHFYKMKIRLLDNFECNHCVLRWHYKAGNNWGVCENGTEALGCGPQEFFRNCADVAITSKIRIPCRKLPAFNLKKKKMKKINKHLIINARR